MQVKIKYKNEEGEQVETIEAVSESEMSEKISARTKELREAGVISFRIEGEGAVQ